MATDKQTGQPEQLAAQTRADAERRQLTVMFVDLVGSTALSAKLDPEDMREVIRAYQDTCAGVIARFEGFVAKFMGDGVLAYFGYPTAHEDEAERAVRAGLALAEATARLTTPAGEPLSARIGMATGVVVVGDLIGEGAAQEQAVVGDTPNLAARLQGLAAPGQVVIAEGTRRLLGDLFEVEDLGAQSLKGIAAPTHALAVLRERALESRFEARSGGLAVLVGREHELALLVERWRQASAGEGQVVLLSGEAGIGKSRITSALIDAVAEAAHIRISYQCSPYHTESPLWPVTRQLSHAAGHAASDPAEVKLDKLEELLARADIELGNGPALLARLLGIGAGQRTALPDLSPQQLRAQTLNALLDQLVGLGRRSPVLLVLEDAHWIDPTTLEMVELALDRIGGERVMLLITARPTFEHAFGGHPIVTRLALNRLGSAQTRAIALRVTRGKALPERVLAEIAAKTDGVPLFVEELTKTVIESGYLEEGADAYTLEGTLPPSVIPSSLHDSLMARLDRLQPLKQVAQTAACIGRSFDYRLLAAISPLPGAELSQSLAGLVGAELVFRRGLDPEATYTFKHALVRDAAYESLLRSRRREVHQTIVEQLKAEDGTLPEVLAYHAQEAGLADEAINHWQTAGEHALARPAYAEALKHFETALAMLRDQPDGQRRQQREVGLLLLIGQARMAYLGYAAETTVAAFDEAERITRALPDPELRFPALYGTWAGHYVRGELPVALERAGVLRREADSLDALVPRMIGHRIQGSTLVIMGRVSEAKAELEAARALYDPKLHVGLARRFGQEPGVANDCYLALALALEGALDSAVRLTSTTAGRLDAINHANTTGYVLGHLGLVATIINVPDLAVELAELGVEQARRQQLPLWEGTCLCNTGMCQINEGCWSEAVSSFENSIALMQRTGSWILVSRLHACGALALARCGRLAEAREQLEEARRIVTDNQERWFEPEVWRIEGLLALDSGDQHAAEARFQDALATARRLGLRLWELRAATTLARLWAEQGKGKEAHDLVHPIYAGFTEGFDLPDLKGAKALLDEMA